jgi:hypothetical protein
MPPATQSAGHKAPVQLGSSPRPLTSPKTTPQDRRSRREFTASRRISAACAEARASSQEALPPGCRKPTTSPSSFIASGERDALELQRDTIAKRRRRDEDLGLLDPLHELGHRANLVVAQANSKRRWIRSLRSSTAPRFDVARSAPRAEGAVVDSLAMLRKLKTWLVKVMPFLARWGSNTTPNP